MTPFQMLYEFHEKFGAAINKPLSEDLIDLRVDLINEEWEEVQSELCEGNTWTEDFEWEIFDGSLIDKKKLTKELADLMYVTIGTAVTFGLPLEEVFAETHKSNMSKLGEDGKPVYRADGKVLKGPNYQPPNLDQFFEKN